MTGQVPGGFPIDPPPLSPRIRKLPQQHTKQANLFRIVPKTKMFIKSTIEHTLYAICHDANASLDEIRHRLGLYMSVNPMGPDVSIQMHTFIFSSSDGRAVLNTVNHLRWMVSRVAKLVDIGRDIERIVTVLSGNMVEIHKLRALLSGVELGELPVLPPGDYELRVRRTRGLLDAVRRSLVPGDEGLDAVEPAETVDVQGVFDHGRFFFQGKYPEPPVLTPGTAEFIAGMLADSFGETTIAVQEMDEIFGTIEYVLKFYTLLLEQIERVVGFASSMFDSYSTVGTMVVACNTPKTVKTKRDFSHVHVPEGVVRPVEDAASEQTEEGEEEEDMEEASGSETPKKRRKYRKALPKPLGFEPEGATTTTGRKKNFPKPQTMSLCAMLVHCINVVGYSAPEGSSLKSAGIFQVIERLPATNVVRMRLEEYHQTDFNERYLPALAKILVNYSYAEVSRNMKRITDIQEHQSDLLRTLYLEEHQRVSAGGAKPTFEELTSSNMNLSDLDNMFTLDDLREHLDVLFV